MTHSGKSVFLKKSPLLVLIPLLLDDPLWGETPERFKYEPAVLIPLLLDDPLWARMFYTEDEDYRSLNPSFAG